MPHFTEFNAHPPFPNDVPIVKLERLSLSQLRNGNAGESSAGESSALFEACKNDGFFLLDLREDEKGERILTKAGRLFDMGKLLFDLPYDKKMEFVMGGARSVFGYKGVGLSKVDSQGTPDRYEFWGISKDDLLGLSSRLSAPDIVNENRSLFQDFLEHNHELELHVIEHLEKHLHLPTGVMASLHTLDKLSGDLVRILKYDSQPQLDRRTSLVPHTDFGSITSLFNILGGLQVLPIGKPDIDENWEYVRPQTGHAIINLGDSMVKWSNGLLKSAMYRVTYAPCKQADATRWSLAYLGHAHNESLMKRMEGSDVIPSLKAGVVEENMTAEDWLYVRSTSYKQKDMKDFEKVMEVENEVPVVE